jgi:hypothetical protein
MKIVRKKSEIDNTFLKNEKNEKMKVHIFHIMLFNIKIVKPNELSSIDGSRYICVKKVNQKISSSEKNLI